MSKRPTGLRARVSELPPTWIVVASRPRDGNDLSWMDHPRAPISQAEAHTAVAAGYLVGACRHRHDRVEYVVQPIARVFA